MNIVKIDEKIFREYDIRGIYGTDLTEDVAYTMGRSFASYIALKGQNKVIVGYDNRISSPILYNALVKGLIESGANVISLGLVTTPMYYFAKKKLAIESGLMITASHNPKEYNGFKISFDLMGNAYGKLITDFRDFTNNHNFISGTGSLSMYDITNEYLELIKNSLLMGNRKVKVVVDCGNGTGSIIIKKVLDMLNIEYYLLNCESDPNFPNHQPDPCVPANQQELARKVVELGYDLGFGIDGDGDRVGLVDELGNILSTDYYSILMYRYTNIPDKRAIYDVKSSRVLIDELNRLGFTHKMNRTGNSYMNMEINKGKYLYGGEFSGHVWFNDRFMGFDDGIYAGLRAVELISRSEYTLSQLLAGTNKYFSTSEIKIEVTEENKFKIVDLFENYCINKQYKYENIDGVRVEFPNGWALVRVSNTGPHLTVRYEATTEEELNKIKEEFDNIINLLK